MYKQTSLLQASARLLIDAEIHRSTGGMSMTNQESASAMKIPQRCHDRSITYTLGRSHHLASTCKSIPISFLLAATLMVGLSACASDSPPVGSVSAVTGAVNAPGGPESYEVIGCMLPGQVRQLGTQMTYVTERRPVRTTKEDCTIRGGEHVPGDRAN